MFQVSTLILMTLLLQTPSLDSASPKERIDAVEQMSVLGKTQNIAPLAEALKKEPRSDVRAAIVAGLARIGVPEVIPILNDSLLTDLDKDVRLQVIDSMQRMYIPVPSQGPIRTIFNRVKSAFAEPDRPLVYNPASVDPTVNATLAEAMQKDFNEDVRSAAARALGSLRAGDKLGVLISTLESPQNREHKQVRLEIVESLGLIRDASAGPALQRTLRDDDRKIVQAAILSLGLVAYKEARPELENIFQNDRSSVSRSNALEAIALMRDQGASPLFQSLLGHSDDFYREMAAEGLARIEHDPSILKPRYETEKKANVRNALAFALVSAGQDEYFNDLAVALDSKQAYQARVYIFELGKFEGKLSELHRYLRSSSPAIRAGMVAIVGNIGDPSSRPLVEELTRDSDSQVAAEAIVALRKLTPA